MVAANPLLEIRARDAPPAERDDAGEAAGSGHTFGLADIFRRRIAFRLVVMLEPANPAEGRRTFGDLSS
jgi:hypothetical protein